MLAVLVGSVAQWLTVAVVVIGALVIWRGGGGTAMQTLQTANRILERRVHELETQGKHDAAKIAELTGKTDVTEALLPIVAWTTHHEERAQERHDGTLKVLALIAERLGPEANGAQS